MRIKKPKLVLVTNNLGSQSLKRLSQVLSEKLNYKVYRVKPGRERGRSSVAFHKGIDKLTQFNLFSANNVSCPKFTTDTSFGGLVEFKDQKIVARTLLNSSEGKGIIIFPATQENNIPRARLYTQYVPKKAEFRVHVFNNVVIDIAQKRKRKDRNEETSDTHIRNLANGYVFCREGITEPEGIRELAVRAVNALSRTQGAVDIIYNANQNKCYVLEVNSIPGMEGTTLEKYSQAILEAIHG